MYSIWVHCTLLPYKSVIVVHKLYKMLQHVGSVQFPPFMWARWHIINY